MKVNMPDPQTFACRRGLDDTDAKAFKEIVDCFDKFVLGCYVDENSTDEEKAKYLDGIEATDKLLREASRRVVDALLAYLEERHQAVIKAVTERSLPA